ncbi:MAG: YihA family ribosome biogenesis GTP-binding protein [Chitinophagaceae bacterium]
MEIIDASYLISSPSVDMCPEPNQPEYAFIGRSNVGKSSLINTICNKKEVAKVSSSPGKTQMINHFVIKSSDKKEWYLVDLPGYGFAKVSQQQRKQWQKMIEGYIRTRTNLMNLFVLIDSRVAPQGLDLKFIDQLGEWQIPFAMVFTKADKITQKEVAKNVKNFIDALSESWEEIPPYFVTSAVKHLGCKQIRNFIGTINEEFYHKKEQGLI